jgi:hypothetical protein
VVVAFRALFQARHKGDKLFIRKRKIDFIVALEQTKKKLFLTKLFCVKTLDLLLN